MKRIAAAAGVVVLCACAGSAPDSVLVNGKIFTSNPAQPWAQALAIKGDRITAVGTTAMVDALAASSTRRLDLKGRTVVPGFNDAHLHVSPHPPRTQVQVPEDPAPSDVEKAIGEANRSAPAGEYLEVSIGSRILDDRAIDRAWIDARVPDRPVVLLAFTGHGLILNSAALRLAQIDESIGDPEGGRFDRDRSGRLSGRVHEYAEQLVWRRIGALVAASEAPEAYRRQSVQAARLGITSIQVMGGDLPQAKVVAALLAAESPLRWRLFRFPIREAGQDLTDSKPLLPPQPSPRIDARGMKWVLDGTPVERLAAVREPYRDSASKGQMNLSPERLRQVVGWAYGSEDLLAVHAVGDAAIDAYFSTLEAVGRPEVWRLKRPRLEHGDMLFPDLIARAKALGVVVVQNPSHLAVPLGTLGPERRRQIQPLKTLVTQGVPLALGSDGPLSPFLNIMFATTHPGRPEEALTREEAVMAYTRGSAYAEFTDEEKGHLSPGALADLAVLSADLFEAPANRLPEIVSVLTVVGGRIVHDSGVVGR